MSTIEERLARDIEAVTGGIVVTDSDLRDARNQVQQRISGRQQRHRRRGVVAAAAAAAVVVGVATWQSLGSDDETLSPTEPVPTPTSTSLSAADRTFLVGDAPTAEELAGVWRLDNPTVSRMLFMFTADGSFSYDDTGQLSADPMVHGTFVVDGDTIGVDVDGGTAACAGRTLSLRAAMAAGGGLHIVPVGLGDFDCDRPFRPQWALERVLPGGMGGLEAPAEAVWRPVTGPEVVVATWLDPQGEYVSELRGDGTYTVLTGPGELADLGTWTLSDSSSRLSLTSSGDSPSCQSGDQFVLSNLQATDFGTLVIRGDVARKDCQVLLRAEAWFSLAP